MRPGSLQPRDPEAQQEDDEDARDAAENIDVRDRCHDRKRKKGRTGQAAHDRESEREHEDEHLGQQEQLDVLPESHREDGQNESKNCSPEKKLCWTRGQPGDDTIT